MDQQELHRWEGRCIQEEPPACLAGCPLGVDGRLFSQAMKRHDLAAARLVLEKSMPLAGIVGRLCEAPCEGFCIRKDFGGAVALGDLERYCLGAGPGRGKGLRLPGRDKRVAVLGGGPSGLVAAFELARKGYPVDLYHLGAQPGGWLRTLPETRLPAAVLDEELRFLHSLGVTFHAVPELDPGLPALAGADACYLGRDDDGAIALLATLSAPDEVTFALERPGTFAGGIAAGDHPQRLILSVSQGREAAVSIDRYLQGASLTASRVLLRHGRTELYTDTTAVTPQPRVAAAGDGGYSSDEATREASRCLHCQCLECVKHCVYLAEYGAYPKVYARRIYNNSAIVKGIHQANRFINGCSLCDQCRTLCPNDFSMAELCLDARRQMVREKRMPPSAHWFAISEMRAAASETALIRHAPGQKTSRWLFFPGCQLAGIRPAQTLALYRHLLAQDARTGLWLDCCGAPAHWAGREEELAAMLAKLKALWQEMDEPPVLVACSSCRKLFGEQLPEVTTVSLWSYLRHKPLPPAAATTVPLAISDPCSARHDTETRQAVRDLAAAIGQELSPLAMSGELTECCGYGGLMDNADPALAAKVARARTAQSEAPLLTYCAMCHDRLATTGQKTLHLLDLLFPGDADAASLPPASLSSRREGRRALVADARRLHGEEPAGSGRAGDDLHLAIAADVAARLDERRILVEDIRHVLSAAGRGSSFTHRGSGRRLAAGRRGEVTFWVSYRLEGSVHHIDGAWSHRMTIGTEDGP